MALSLAQLLTPSSEEQSLESLLTILTGLGFPARSWQSGSIQRTLVQLLARLHASASNTTLTITKGRYSDTATGDWLSLLSTSQFDNTRNAAVASRCTIRLKDPNSVGPFTIVLGQLVATDPAGYTYRNITAGTLAAGGQLDLTFEAESPGSASLPAPLMTLATPLAGVDIELPSGYLTRPGSNAESDERLRTRNKGKWSTLAYAAPADAFVVWALNAHASITRAWVDDLNPRGPGTVDIYVAGSTGTALPAPVLQAVYDYMTGAVDGVYRRPLGCNIGTSSVPAVFNAGLQNITVGGTLYVNPSYSQTAVLADVVTKVTALMQALPVGGTVKLAELYSTIMGVAGVKNVHLTAPTGDVTVAQTSVPVPVFSLTTLVG